MVRIQHVSKGAETVEVMSNLAYYLLTTGLAKEEENCGFQEGSYALCDFEIHVIKKQVNNK